MLDPNAILRRLVADIRVELTDEFDRNFQRKAFFTEKWKKRRDKNAKGTLLVVTGTLRRSIQAKETDHGVRFSSQVPYATVHNEGGTGTKPVRAHKRRLNGKTHNVRAHTRRFTMPQRQFVGDGEKTRSLIEGVIRDTLTEINIELQKLLTRQNNSAENFAPTRHKPSNSRPFVPIRKFLCSFSHFLSIFADK